MSTRYTAKVYFPAEALNIPEISAAYEGDFWDDRDVDGDVACVTDNQARDGDMYEITPLLQKHRVPFDHEHQDPGDDLGHYTWHRRPAPDGTWGHTVTNNVTEQVASNAKEYLEILVTKGAMALRDRLKDVIKQNTPAPFTDWKLPEQNKEKTE